MWRGGRLAVECDGTHWLGSAQQGKTRAHSRSRDCLSLAILLHSVYNNQGRCRGRGKSRGSPQKNKVIPFSPPLLQPRWHQPSVNSSMSATAAERKERNGWCGSVHKLPLGDSSLQTSSPATNPAKSRPRMTPPEPASSVVSTAAYTSGDSNATHSSIAAFHTLQPAIDTNLKEMLVTLRSSLF